MPSHFFSSLSGNPVFPSQERAILLSFQELMSTIRPFNVNFPFKKRGLPKETTSELQQNITCQNNTVLQFYRLYLKEGLVEPTLCVHIRTLLFGYSSGVGEHCGLDFPDRICIMGTECLDGVCVAIKIVVNPGTGKLSDFYQTSDQHEGNSNFLP